MEVAYYCVLAAGLLPLLSAGIAKAGTFTPADNHNPRDFHARQSGYRQRANWSQQNGFEAFPLFAAAVIIAGLKNADANLVAKLAIAFVVFRVLYIACYVADWATLRSVMWFGALGSAIAMFFL